MPLVPIKDLGLGGVVTDKMPSDLQLNELTNAVNVEFNHDRARKMFGNIDVGLDFGGEENLSWFQPWLDDGLLRQAFTAGDKILYLDDTGLVLTASTPALASSEDWQSSVFGEFGVLNNRIDEPIYSQNTDGSVWATLPGWGANATSPSGPARTIRSFKNVLFALGLSPDRHTLYWSAPGDTNTFPQSWDYGDISTLAGFYPLNDSDGELVDAAALGNALIVYSQFAAYAVTISRDFRVFDLRRLFSWGLANRDCAVSFENFHFCVSPEVIYIHDGSRIRRVADNKIEEQFFAENSNLQRTYVTKDSENHTILVYYPVGNAQYPNRVLKYNWLESQAGNWTFEDLDTETRCIRQSLRPPITTTWQDLLDQNVSWGDLKNTAWGSFDKQDPRTSMFMLRNDRYLERDQTTRRQGLDFNGWIERTHIDLDEVKNDVQQIMFLRKVYPRIRGTGQVNFMFGGSNDLSGPIRWGPIQPFDMDAGDYKVDTRVSGRYLHYRIGSWGDTPLPGEWELTGMDWDIELEGFR